MALNDEEIYEEILHCTSPTLDSEPNNISTDALIEDGVKQIEEIGSKIQNDERKPLDDPPDAEAFNDAPDFDEGGENIVVDEMFTSNIEMNLNNVPIVIIPEGVDAAAFLSQAVIDATIEQNYETDSIEHNKISFLSGVIDPEDKSEVFVEEANDNISRNEITDQQDDSDPEFNVDNLFESSSDTDNPSDLEYEPEARIESRVPNTPENLPSDLEDEPEPITEIRQQNTSYTSPLLNNHNDEEEIPVLPERKRKKNNQSNWKKNVNKKLRMSGEAYLGYRRTKEGVVYHDQDRGERKLGPHCGSNKCRKSKNRHCFSFTQDQRKSIFNNFWAGMNWDQRKVYLVNMAVKSKKQRQTTEEEKSSRRNNTLNYFLTADGVKKQVCQKMFLQTLGIKQWTVRYWVSGDQYVGKEPLENHTSAGMVPQGTTTRPSSAKKFKKPRAKDFAKSFLDTIPKLPSHYCRQDSTRLYLEPMFRSLSHLYNVYKDKCVEDFQEESKSITLSRFTFEKLFKDNNLALYQPKKDRCDVCVGFEVGNITGKDHTIHMNLKNEAREEKTKDKKEAKENKCIVYSSDVQAVKLCPFLNASALYYKTKLNIHNFTMYNLASQDVQCFWFDETSADLVASVFASCVIDTLKTQFAKDPKPIVLWSDGCPPQNKNAVFANALLHFAVENKTTVEQKFLVKGHTQMECDSVHSTIETALKDVPVYLPSQYNEIALRARQIPFPYQSKYLSHSFFKDFSQQKTLIYDSIRPGNRKGDPTVYDIVAIRYKPNGKIETKLSFKSEYKELPRRPRSNHFTSEFLPLYQKKLPIKTSKYKHLQELKSVIPEDCHPYYDSLPHTA